MISLTNCRLVKYNDYYGSYEKSYEEEEVRYLRDVHILAQQICEIAQKHCNIFNCPVEAFVESFNNFRRLEMTGRLGDKSDY